jgi:hypothetical protein
MIRTVPFELCVSFANVDMLSRLRAFVSVFSVCLIALGLSSISCSCRSSSISRREYHEVAHRGKLAHGLPVLRGGLQHDRLLVLDRIAVVARRDQHAPREPLHVPLPRTRQRLVEVVDVEHEPPLGRREHTEVRQVGLAAALDVQARPRRRSEIARHDPCRTSVERERRDEHPPVADRNELRHPCLGLLLEQLDGIGAIRRRVIHRVARAGHFRARRLATGGAFGHREVRYESAGLGLCDSYHLPILPPSERCASSVPGDRLRSRRARRASGFAPRSLARAARRTPRTLAPGAADPVNASPTTPGRMSPSGSESRSLA